MLPDYPETKRLFTRLFATYMRDRMREISPFGMIKARRIYEGRAMRVTRSDDSKSESNVVEQSVAFEIKFDEIETLTLEKVLRKYDAVVVEMVTKQANLIRERIAAEIPASNSIDGRGRKLDAQMYLEMVGAMQVDFNPDGTPHEIHIDPPLTSERVAALNKEFEESPELKKKYEALIAKKKEEWLAREGDRKLVG